MANNIIFLSMFIIVFSHLHIHFATSSNSTRCREIEWKALMDFKGSLVDRDNELGWTGRDCCSWYGITCHNRTGFVQKISLNLDLGGQINSSLLDLEHLEFLDLSYNRFLGIQIPAFLGSLKNLQVLDLWEAGFSGEIPQHLGNLSNLRTLSLKSTWPYPQFEAHSLNWITGLSSLRTLWLETVNLSKSVDWFDSINRLSSLSTLFLLDCGLVGMTLSHDFNLTSLVSVTTSGNNLNSALPFNFFNISSRFEDIQISNSSLRGPIPSMFQQTTLHRLDLSDNSFRSSLPDSLCALNGLESLDLARSELQGFLPSCLGNLTKLTSLQLNDNQFSGKIPSSLGKLTNLSTIDISSNSLVGQLSESFFDELISLQDLDFSKNLGIVFNVSSQWIPPFQIQSLGMEFVFIGTLFPAWLQNQTGLTRLSLKNASIYGAIPDWCQTSYPNLQSFDLSNNFLTGPIPTFNVMNKETLTILELSKNQFTGKILDEICNLLLLQILKLANNQLIGRIPSCLGNLQQLQLLDLANNNLSDHVPNEIGYLNQLIFLRLNGNMLSGEIPLSLQNLTLLRTLDLGKNELQGSVPKWIGKEFLALEHLMLQSNNFSGEIPLNICQLPSLRIINLSDNNIVGTIPPCLKNLSTMFSNDSIAYLSDTYSSYYDPLVAIIIKGIELEYSSSLIYAKFISLSGNHLHGNIPDELMVLTEVQSLNLSNNRLSGNIPERIGDMKNLQSLDLSKNQLSGAIPQGLAGIDGLGFLSLSFNNFSGRIPSGGHFDTFDDLSIYEGNGDLCGKPTTKICDDDSIPKQNGPVSDGDDEIEIEWLYAGIAPGFAVGFLGILSLLYFKSSWRYSFFRFMENMYSKF